MEDSNIEPIITEPINNEDVMNSGYKLIFVREILRQTNYIAKYHNEMQDSWNT